MHGLLAGYQAFMLGYLVVLDGIYMVLAVIGWTTVDNYVRRRPFRDYDGVARSAVSMPVTILAPCYDEEPTVVDSVRALLASRYAEFEVLVVNDGSSDRTLAVLRDAFALVEVHRTPRANLPTAAIRAVYVSAADPRVVVIDKENGGKADALNAGLRYARYPLVCAIDADTLLDPGALARLAWEFQAYPDTVASGGIVRIINGSTVRDGRVADVRTPRSLVVNLQIMEYLRAFLGGRIAWSRMRMLVIISGAFSLFRRDAVIEVGGYDTATVGEDAELVLRLHRAAREARRPCRITFQPDPICWTEAPSSLRVLARQRDRWQRGLAEMLVKHRGMILRPRYGRVGMLALPYFVAFELLGPIVELLGFLTFAVLLAGGVVSAGYAIAFLALSVLFGLVLSFASLLMEQRAFRRYPGWRDLSRLVLAATVENLGYRQWTSLVRVRAFVTLLRGGGGWGDMTRTGFGDPPPAPPLAAETPVPAHA